MASSVLIQFGASLIAVLALAGLARWFGLGGDVRLRDADEARRLADDAVCGFDAAEVVLDRAGTGALLRDREGRVMLLRRHGARWAARMLDRHARIRIDRDILRIATPDRRFGEATLDLGAEAQVWAGNLRGLG